MKEYFELANNFPQVLNLGERFSLDSNRSCTMKIFCPTFNINSFQIIHVSSFTET